MTFDTRAYEIYQALHSVNDETYFIDWNIKFAKEIYGTDIFNSFSVDNEKDARILFEKMKRKRNVWKKVFNLSRFTYSKLNLCNYENDEKIENILTNFNKTLLYRFYVDNLLELKLKIGGNNLGKVEFYVSVDSFE